MTENQDNFSKLSYEEKVEKLDEILTRLDNSETPIDKLARMSSWRPPDKGTG